MSGGGGKTKSTNVTQNYSPEEAARRAQVMDQAQAIYNQTQGQYVPGSYPGAQVAPFDPATLLGQQTTMNAANMGQQTNQQLAGGVQYGLSGAMDVNNNPYLQKAVSGALEQVGQKYTDPNGVLANIRGGAEQAGQYGGSRQGVAEGIAARDYAHELGNTAAGMYSDAYNKGQDTFSRTLATAPQVLQGYGLPGQLQSAVGAQNENLAQAMQDYAAQGREWDLNAPWIPLNNYSDIVYSGGGSQSTSTATAPRAARNPVMGAAGGALTGWAAGAAMGAGMGPVGAVAGGILGALFS